MNFENVYQRWYLENLVVDKTGLDWYRWEGKVRTWFLASPSNKVTSFMGFGTWEAEENHGSRGQDRVPEVDTPSTGIVEKYLPATAIFLPKHLNTNLQYSQKRHSIISKICSNLRYTFTSTIKLVHCNLY